LVGSYLIVLHSGLVLIYKTSDLEKSLITLIKALMKFAFVIGLFFGTQCVHSQSISTHKENTISKGYLYFYWGWNQSVYTNSDLRFKGNGFDFKLRDVIAKDRQVPFTGKDYFHPGYFTTPQYNFRLGYFIKDGWSVSFAIDHMKYVVQPYQEVIIDGFIENTFTEYNGNYENETVSIDPNFLRFEHTDGLNYLSLGVHRFLSLLNLNDFSIQTTQGASFGVLVPKSEIILLSKRESDQFHLAGYGVSALLGLRLSVWNALFVQSEMKGGFIHMPKIRITDNKSDFASQHFFYYQYNLTFGGIFNLNRQVEIAPVAY